jgi:hypothetical protein
MRFEALKNIAKTTKMNILRNMRKVIYIASCAFFIPLIYLLTSSAIVAILLGLLISFPISRIKEEYNWAALAAFITLLALIFAVYSQELRFIINKPTVQYSFFEVNPPHLIEQVGTSIKRVNGGVMPISFKGQFLTLQLINSGKIIAKDTEVLLTDVWYKDVQKKWKRKKNWIAVPLKWIPPMYESSGSTIMTRSLTPKRPYRFNIGSISTEHKKGQFFFAYYISLILQEDAVSHGEYWFEITAYAENMDPKKKYIYIKFNDFADVAENDTKELKNRVTRIELADTPSFSEPF